MRQWFYSIEFEGGFYIHSIKGDSWNSNFSEIEQVIYISLMVQMEARERFLYLYTSSIGIMPIEVNLSSFRSCFSACLILRKGLPTFLFLTFVNSVWTLSITLIKQCPNRFLAYLRLFRKCFCSLTGSSIWWCLFCMFLFSLSAQEPYLKFSDYIQQSFL